MGDWHLHWAVSLVSLVRGKAWGDFAAPVCPQLPLRGEGAPGCSEALAQVHLIRAAAAVPRAATGSPSPPPAGVTRPSVPAAGAAAPTLPRSHAPSSACARTRFPARLFLGDLHSPPRLVHVSAPLVLLFPA